MNIRLCGTFCFYFFCLMERRNYCDFFYKYILVGKTTKNDLVNTSESVSNKIDTTTFLQKS